MELARKTSFLCAIVPTRSSRTVRGNLMFNLTVIDVKVLSLPGGAAVYYALRDLVRAVPFLF